MATWQHIVEEHSPLVWRLAYRLLGTESDAADCYQTVFLQAFEASRKEDVANWPGFLSRLTTTRAIDVLRARSRQRIETGDVEQLPQSAESDPAHLAEHRELVADLRHALTWIPSEQAEVFALRYFEQLSNQQIAAQLGTSANRIGVLLHRARESLKLRINRSDRRNHVREG